MAQTSEHAFESYVMQMLSENGWQHGAAEAWDKALALFPDHITAFLSDTQSALWNQMGALHGDQLETMVIKALVKELAIKGTLHILRHGFRFYGKIFQTACFKPAHGLNEEMLALYGRNMLTVTRQVPCHPGDQSTVDLLFALNGLPVGTCELKNPRTGQSWRHAVRQYKQDRDPRAPLFEFKKRALVHFAADPDEVYMTTRPAGDHTFFRPFNRGSHPGEIKCGAGNPQHPSGYRSGYLWESVLTRESFLDILGHFLFDEVDLQFYRLQRVFSGAIELHEDPENEFGVKSPTDVGSRKAKDEKAPLSEIIELLNERFGTDFTEEDRLFFEQIKEKATNHPQVIQLRQANPFDKFQLGLKKLLEDLMIQRMGENDKIVTRHMDDQDFGSVAFRVLAKVIYDSIPAGSD